MRFFFRPGLVRSALLAAALTGASLAPAAAQADDTTVAVMYFENAGNPDLEVLRLGLAQMLITDLQGTEGVQVVERQRLQEILAELELSRSDLVDPARAAQVGRVLGAERMVMGSYFEFLGTLTITANLVEVETTAILASEQVQGVKQDFQSLQDQLAMALKPQLSVAGVETSSGGGAEVGRVRGGGGEAVADAGTDGGGSNDNSGAGAEADPQVAADTSENEETVRGGSPPSDEEALEAALAFSEGLDYLDRNDMTRAREALGRALELDPGLEDARSMLAGLDV